MNDLAADPVADAQPPKEQALNAPKAALQQIYHLMIPLYHLMILRRCLRAGAHARLVALRP